MGNEKGEPTMKNLRKLSVFAVVLALVFAFLCLAALYESWSIPTRRSTSSSTA